MSFAEAKNAPSVSSELTGGNIQVGPEFTEIVGGSHTGNIRALTHQPHLVSRLMLPSGLNRPHLLTQTGQLPVERLGKGPTGPSDLLSSDVARQVLGIPLALCHPVNSKGSWLLAYQQPSPCSCGLRWVSDHYKYLVLG